MEEEDEGDDPGQDHMGCSYEEPWAEYIFEHGPSMVLNMILTWS